MQNTAWKYYLLDSAGKPYRKENGVVVAKNDIYPLKFTPTGWQDISIAWERDVSRFGLVRNFSLPLEFVIDGADIMRAILYGTNYDQKISLLIQKQKLFIDTVNYYYYYDYFYKGEVDFTSFKDEENKFTASIAEGGLVKDLKANTKTNYEIPCDEITVQMDGFPLHQTGNFSIVDGVEIKKSVWGDAFYVPISYRNSDGQSVGIDFTQESLNGSPSNFAAKISDKFGFAAGNGDIKQIHVPSLLPYIPVTITGTVKYMFTVNDLPFGFRMRFLTSELTIPTQNIYQIDNTGPVTPGSVHSHNFSFVINVYQLSQLHLEGIFFGGVTGAIDIGIQFLEGSDFTVSFSNTFTTTYIKAMVARTLFDRLCQKISPGCYDKSALLDSFKDIAVTSFDAVRGLVNSVVKTNMDDFFTSINAVLNCGMGVQRTEVTPGTFSQAITLESKDFYFDDSNPIELGEVKDFVVTLFKDILANAVKIGYVPQDVNSVTDVNGRQEFNTTAEYSSTIKKIVKTLELISAYRADPFGIENGRLNLEGKKTTADNADNDVCFLAIDYENPQLDADGNTYYKLKRKTYDVITGLLDPIPMFNIEYLTPKRMLTRHASWLNSIFTGFEGQSLKFETISRNRDLYTQKGTEIYDEDSDFMITMDGKILEPYLFEFTPETPRDLVELLEENNNRCFSFIHPINGLTYKGFNYKVGISPDSLNSQAFLLIAAPETDLKTLIT